MKPGWWLREDWPQLPASANTTLTRPSLRGVRDPHPNPLPEGEGANAGPKPLTKQSSKILIFSNWIATLRSQ
jgi:hypothetical protein